MSIITDIKLLDINECDLNIDGCDQICVNTVGSFLCNCTDGFIVNEDGFSCDGKKRHEYWYFIFHCSLFLPDVDECALDIDGCDQGCNNTVGSFNCTCMEGYVLNEDGFTCDGKETMKKVS